MSSARGGDQRHAVAAVRKPHRGQFQPGNPGGGRPLGSRNRLSEIALAALSTDAAEHAAAVIAEVRKTRPHIWLQVIVSLLPRQVQMEKLTPFSDISDQELDQIEQLLTAIRARTVSELEQYNGTAIALEPEAKQDS